MKVFFSPDYSVDAGAHVFPTRKFAMTIEGLLARGLVRADEVVDPGEASREDLLLAHTPEWVDKVLSGGLTLSDETLMELPWSPALARAHRKSVAGTIAACREALATGLGLHAGGGAHHAFADHGEGFCVFNDLVCAARRMRAEREGLCSAVVDLDVHQGNGTAALCAGDPSCSALSVHQEDLYPEVKPPGGEDLGLPAGTSDEKYLKLLKERLGPFLDARRPGLVLYLAGVDCFEEDLLGGLKLSRDGISRRDEAVFEECFARGIAVAVVLGGGYARRLEDTVALHVRTLEVAMGSHRRSGARREGNG